MRTLLLIGLVLGLAGAQPAAPDAEALEREGRYVQALQAQEEIGKRLAQKRGPAHPEVARNLYRQAWLQHMLAEYRTAEALYQRAIAIQRQALGPRHPELARSLAGLAATYNSLGRFEESSPLVEEAMRIQTEVLGPRHPDLAESMLISCRSARHQDTMAIASRALRILEETVGERDVRVAYALQLMARRGDTTDRVIGWAERSVSILEQTVGSEHPLLAEGLKVLARVRNVYRVGLVEDIVELYQRALRIQRRTLPADHLLIAGTMHDLGVLYTDRGQVEEGRAYMTRVLEMMQRRLPFYHHNVAISLLQLADADAQQGDCAQATGKLRQAIQIFERLAATGGGNEDALAQALLLLSRCHAARQEHESALEAAQDALRWQERVAGQRNPERAESLIQMAAHQRALSRFTKAEALLAEAVRITPDNQPTNSCNITQERTRILAARGDLAGALRLHDRTWRACDARYGPDTPAALALLDLRARLLAAQGRLAEATAVLRDVLLRTERRARREAPLMAEERLRPFLLAQGAQDSLLFSLLLRHAADPALRRLALSAVLLHKGRSLGEAMALSQALYHGLSDADRQKLARLRALRGEIAGLALSGKGSWAAQEREAEQIEEDLARRSLPLRAQRALPDADQIPGAVARALPRDGALIELMRFDRLDLGRSFARDTSTPWYLGLVLLPDERITLADLGPAAAMDEAARRLLGDLADPKRDPEKASREVHDRLVRPLRPLLAGRRRLFVAPDGPLHFLPFSALRDEAGPLLGRDLITYLTSGKDLLPATPVTPAQDVVVLADPAFGQAPQTPGTGARTRGGALRDGQLQLPALPPLPATREEAHALRALLPGARLLLGADASEPALLSLDHPGILHVATHGLFFEPDAPTPAGSRAAPRGIRRPAAGPPPGNPLLRSMLALAGAGVLAARPPAPGEEGHADGVVTALEIGGMNLWGTQLVVLSACDTGRGDVLPGQGVFGLRRAVMAAGAETLVTSLWRVDDKATRALIVRYYEGLLAGLGRAEAMQAAARSM
jgi:CHAT domain-containing protein/tetratricopeptide (TPR) repeat protein